LISVPTSFHVSKLA